jgi:hypothetical protein
MTLPSRNLPLPDPLCRALSGVTLIWLYLAVLATVAVVATFVQPGGPF